MKTPVKIKALDFEILEHNVIALAYYKRNYNFQTISKKGEYIGIPIIKEASLFIEKTESDKSIKYPWDEYAHGFILQYGKGIPVPFDKYYILDLIQPNPWLPSFISDRADSRQKENAFQYGEKTALSFMAWEHVLRNISEFEFVFMNTKPKSKFSDYLVHDKAPQLADKLTPLIQKSKGTEIGLYILALLGMKVINYINRNQVYNSLGLTQSQCTGANDFIKKHSNDLEKDIQPEIGGRTEQIKDYISKIESIIKGL
jgi:hypothetical protein